MLRSSVERTLAASKREDVCQGKLLHLLSGRAVELAY